MRPIIAVTPSHYERDGIELSSIWRTFIEIIESCGGTTLLIPAGVSDESLSYYLSQINGLLLPGGQDIYPPNFEMTTHEKSGPFDVDRDDIEVRVLRYALEKRIPILGICRGAQLINAYLGGEIHQYLDDEGLIGHAQWKLPEKFRHVHQVIIEDDSILADYGLKKWLVNTGHHQGVKTLGKGLKVSAVAPDGLVEAFESESKGFVLGVQWHPEVLQSKGEHHKFVFAKFIEACHGK